MNWNAELYNQFDIEAYHIRDFLLALAQIYHLPIDLDILDIGCGTGRLLKPLADLGWQVTGLEPHPDYYAAALEWQSAAIKLKQGGFADIDEQEAYHFIVAINAPFAYLLDMPSRQDALARLYRALKPNGLLFLDFPNFLWLLHNYRPPQETIIQTAAGDSLRRLIRHDWDWHQSRFTHSDIFYRNGQYLTTQVHTMSILTPEIIFWLLKETGFSDIRTYNSYAKPQSQNIKHGRILISAQKLL